MVSPRTFKECLDALYSLQSNTAAIQTAIKSSPRVNSSSLCEMRHFLEILNITPNDLSRLKVIHVAGTKGKGSCCAFVESILRQSGLKTGLFTSPHLRCVRERIKINGIPISEDSFTNYFFECWLKLTKSLDLTVLPSFFKFMLLLAFKAFIHEEVGIGGRYDATNVVDKPAVCAITSIGHDHENILGYSLESIAHNKAGIMKKNVPIWTIDRHQSEVFNLFVKEAQNVGCELKIASSSIVPRSIHLGIPGIHQYQNASLAISVCQEWLDLSPKGKQLDPSAIQKALETTSWPGRCQKALWEGKEIFLDGAHTKESMEHFMNWLETQISKDNRKKILLFNCTEDRNYQRIMGPIIQFHNKIPFSKVLAAPSLISTKKEACLDFQQEIAHYASKAFNIPSAVYHSIQEAFLTIQGESYQIIVTGSFYLVGNTLEYLDIPIS